MPPFAMDLCHAPKDVITALFGNMSLKQRFTCALVCSDWSKAAAATTHSIVKHGLRDLTGLQQWLSRNGRHVKAMQLHVCRGAEMDRLPCTQLRDLLLHGEDWDCRLALDSRVWRDIAAATKLTSVVLQQVFTDSQQADVVAALTALPDLQQLTWQEVECGQEGELSDSRLLQQLTSLTGLHLKAVSAEALQHLGSASKLQHLSISGAPEWAAANCPGLQELMGLTSLQLGYRSQGLPSAVNLFTALQQLEVWGVTPTELTCLKALTALTKLRIGDMKPGPTPLQLPALRQLDLCAESYDSNTLHMSQLSSCNQLRDLTLQRFHLVGPDSLAASSMLQELYLHDCTLSSPEGPAYDLGTAGHSWQQVFPGPGRLPHLTSLELCSTDPAPQQADLERLVACCSGLRVLRLYSVELSEPLSWSLTSASALQCLSHLTCLATLHLSTVTDQQCTSLAQLTGLQELEVAYPEQLSPVGLRHLARLQQLTSLSFWEAFDSCKVSTVIQAQLSDTSDGCSSALVNKVRAAGGCKAALTVLLGGVFCVPVRPNVK